MKTLLSYLTAALLVMAAASPTAARADVDIDFFYESLTPYGSWMEVGDYGYVWHPQTDDDWEPYSDGRWVDTEAGWTWVSDEPYSWAVYHYGRWANVIGIGWIWVPDNEWGPGWVSWRSSPEYVGWAPLPPEARFSVNIGFSNWVDSYYDIGPARYRFVPVVSFGARNLRTVFVPRSQNYVIINRSTNITNITYVNNRIVNRGPDFDMISRRSERPIQRLRLDRRDDFNADPRSMRAEDFRTRQEGDSLRFFAPRIGHGSGGAPKVVAQRVREVQFNRGWKGGGVPQEQSDKFRAKLRAEAKAPDALPEKPRFERPTAGGGRTPDATPGTAGRPGRPDSTTPGRPTTTDDTPGRGKGRPDATPGAPTTTDDTPGRGKGRPGAPTTTDDTPGRGGKGRPEGVPGRPSSTDDTPGRGKGHPDATPGAPTTTDDTPGRGKGRPETVPGKPSSTDDTPGRGGKGRPETIPGRGRPDMPKTPSVDIPDRPSTPSEPRPATERRPGAEVRPANPSVERPSIPSRPATPSARPSIPERPSAPSTRPAAPERPATPSARPAAPERPAAAVATPATAERPAAPAARPKTNRGGEARKKKGEE